MQGRLFGKRIQAEYFLDDVVEHGVEGCNYLLALDMEMDPIPGYEMANWEGGYGDFAIVPDMATLRRIPWLDRTALVLCDVCNHDGSPVVASPRQVLIAQYERAHAMGYTPMFASELEFYLYKESYAEAHEKDYRGLTPTIPYILDYHILATTMDEQYLGPIRRGMHARRDTGRVLEGGGLVRAARGEHPLRRCRHLRRPPHDLQERREGDRVPERHLGDVHGEALREGHRQLLPHPLQPRRRAGRQERVRRRQGQGDGRLPPLPRRACAPRIRELALLVAPSINSYKRYATESWAPTSISWGRDNRTCGFRVVGHGASRRVECRIPGADVNPYLGYAALLAAGLDGIEKGTDPGPELKGNAYAEAEAEPFPSTLREAVDLWENSKFARKTFGEGVWRHYLNYGRTEQRLFDEVVTDYERRRMFERG